MKKILVIIFTFLLLVIFISFFVPIKTKTVLDCIPPEGGIRYSLLKGEKDKLDNYVPVTGGAGGPCDKLYDLKLKLYIF